MRIEEYFRKIEEAIQSYAIIQLSEVTFEKRGSHEGFIRGTLTFLDSSMLHFREYVDVEVGSDRLMYVYHYTDSSNHFIFRYDNTGHHKMVGLPTHPHHKHEESESNVLASNAPNLNTVLEEIGMRVEFPK